jgi:HlyD family secretion protein
MVMPKINQFLEVIKKRPAGPLGGTVCLLLIMWAVFSLFADEDAQSSVNNYTVIEGPLKISLSEAGTIQPKEKLVIKNPIEGSTAITFLVVEGNKVKKGDLLIELDSSSLFDKKVNQEIQVQKALASRIEAVENLEVAKNQAQSDVESAQLAYDFAQIDLKKYLEGEYPNALAKANSDIIIAEKEVSQAKDKLDWSTKLNAENYLSQTELNTDTLSYNQKKMMMEIKSSTKDLLVNYTHRRKLAELESNVTQTKSDLERKSRKAKANIARASANKAAKIAEYERQSSKLEKYVSQLEMTRIYAPADGTIIYATSAEQGGRHHSHTEPLKVGNSVQERQELIHLPTTSGFIVNVSMPESCVNKVKVGQFVRVKVDAKPSEVFTGSVTSISNVVNAQTNYTNSDLKLYDVVITLDGSNAELLRSGMSCTAEVIIEQYKNAVYVPMAAVLNVGGKPTVYIVKGDKVKPRTVQTGMDNNAVITVASGLKAGETVTLTPPLEQAGVVE